LAHHDVDDNGGGKPPDLRVGLSLERTLLAWVRTGISLVALGVVLAKFVIFVDRLGIPVHGGTNSERLGLGFVVAGGLLVALAGIRHVMALRRWRRGATEPMGPLLSLLLVGVVVAGAIVAVMTLVP
jgi:putative membrane protein